MTRRLGLPIGIAEGERVGNFTLVELIGAGPAAYTYYAEDAEENGIVLRFLRPEFAQHKDWVVHFTTTAKALSKVAQQTKHKRICRVLGIGFLNDLPYIIEEYCGERSLGYALYYEGVQHAEALRIVSQVADVLSVFHAAQPAMYAVCVRPTDVFLDRRANVTLAHCGLLKSPAAEPPPARKIRSAPPVECMAPELLEGAPPSVAGDVYSLGMLLLRMVKGGYGTARVLDAVRGGRTIEDALPADEDSPSDDLLRRCLQLDPTERLQSLSELLDALDALEGKRAPRSAAPADLIIDPPPKPVPGFAPELEGEEVAVDDWGEDEEEESDKQTSALEATGEADDDFDFASFAEALSRQQAEEDADVGEYAQAEREERAERRRLEEEKKRTRRRRSLVVLDESGWDAALRSAGIVDAEEAVAEVAEPEPVEEAAAEVAEPEPEPVEEAAAEVAEPEPVEEAAAEVAEPEPEPEPEPVREPIAVLLLEELALAALAEDGRDTNGGAASPIESEIARIYRGVPGPITFRTPLRLLTEDALAPVAAVASVTADDGTATALAATANEIALLYPAVEAPMTFRALMEVLNIEALAPPEELADSFGDIGAIAPLAGELALLYPAFAEGLVYRRPLDLQIDAQLAPPFTDGVTAFDGPALLEAQVAELYPAAPGDLLFRTPMPLLLEEALSGREPEAPPVGRAAPSERDAALLYPAPDVALVYRIRTEVLTGPELATAAAAPTHARIVPLSGLAARVRLAELSEAAAALNPLVPKPALTTAGRAKLYPGVPGAITYRPHMRPLLDDDLAPSSLGPPARGRWVVLSTTAGQCALGELAAAAARAELPVTSPALIDSELAQRYPAVPGAITFRSYAQAVELEERLALSVRPRRRRVPRVELGGRLATAAWVELRDLASRARPEMAASTSLTTRELALLRPALWAYEPPRNRVQPEELLVATPPPAPFAVALAHRSDDMEVSAGAAPDLRALVAALDVSGDTTLTDTEIALIFPAPLVPVARPRRRRMPGAFAAAPGTRVEEAEVEEAAPPLVAPRVRTQVTAPMPPPAPAEEARPAAAAAASVEPQVSAPAGRPSIVVGPPPKPTLAQLMLGELSTRNEKFFGVYASRLPTLRRQRRDKTVIQGVEIATDWSPEVAQEHAETIHVSEEDGLDLNFVELGLGNLNDEELDQAVPVELDQATSALSSVAGLVKQTHQARVEGAVGADGELIDVDLDSDFQLTVADMVRLSHEATLANALSVEDLTNDFISLSVGDADLSFDFAALTEQQYAEDVDAEMASDAIDVSSAGGATITVADLLASSEGLDLDVEGGGEGLEVAQSSGGITLDAILAEKRAEEERRRQEKAESFDLTTLDLDAGVAIDALTEGLGLRADESEADAAVAAFEQWKDLPGIAESKKKATKRENSLRGMIFELMAELAIRQGDAALDPRAQEALTTLINAATNFVKLLPGKGG